MNELHKPSERWIIESTNERFIFRREINGKIEESYCPVGKDLAAIYAIAIINGFEPPRQLKEMDGGFIARQVRHQCSDSQSQHDRFHQDKPTD